VFELRDVTKTFTQGAAVIRAVNDVSMRIDAGEFLALVGPSGSGKSTLLQLLGGLDRPTAGNVYFEGRDLGAMRDSELAALRAKTFGFVFQQFNLIPTLTAEQNVEAALAPSKHKTSYRRAAAKARLEEVGLLDRAAHLPSQLSGGEQQRVAIARALVAEPRVILGDEPTGNLDTATGAEIIDLLAYLSREHGATLVIATHDRSLAKAATRVVHLQDGRVASPVPHATHG
jgi:putative ABC transport system ATP-binding protein